jgi:hypothetical protein
VKERKIVLPRTATAPQPENAVEHSQLFAKSGKDPEASFTSITVVILCWHICLISESMGHHDSEIMDDRSID